MIDGCIHVKIMRVDGEVVKVGIEAPDSVPVHRLEVYEEIQRNNQQAAMKPSLPLPKLATKAPAPGTEPGTKPTDKSSSPAPGPGA